MSCFVSVYVSLEIHFPVLDESILRSWKGFPFLQHHCNDYMQTESESGKTWLRHPLYNPTCDSPVCNTLWINIFQKFHSVQFSSVTQSCPTLCDPMNRSTPGLPVHHQLPEFTQTHIHWVWCHLAIASSVIPFSCPQSLPASESFPMSQLFAWAGQSTGASSFSIIPSKEIPGLIAFRMDWLESVLQGSNELHN